MKKIIMLLIGFMFCTLASAAPFTALQPDGPLEPYGVGTITWRLSSQLSRNATGTIELCYVDKNGPVQVLGRVGVRPFISSSTTMPDLRILYAQTVVNSATKAVLIVGYGLRSGCFVVDAPGITSYAKFSKGPPEADSNGEYTLLVTYEGNAMNDATRIQDAAGRLFFRYISQSP